MSEQRVLIFDIETLPIEAYVWDLHDQNIALNQIKEDWSVAAFAAKWLGDPADKVVYRDQRSVRNIRDDSSILKVIWKLLDEADIVVTQNGKKFDSRKLNARFMLHGMQPPSPYRHFDTFLCTHQVADFTSHKLEYLTDKLNDKYKKLKHSGFPGMSLWTECLKRNKAAWEEMKVYNIHDVLSTEELYLKVRPWAPQSFPKVYEVTNAARKCGTCGYVGQMREGKERFTKTYSYKQHACLKCGAWQKGEHVSRIKKVRKAA